MLFDSAFLIHASGQRGRRQHAATEAFLRANMDAPLFTSRICWAEYAEGCVSPNEVQTGLHRFTIIEIDEPIAWIASRLARELRGSGQHIGDNDIWIAATAVAYGLPLVSRNTRHFKRIAGLKLVEY